MEYLSVSQIAEKWGMTVRNIQMLCANGKIEGVTRLGRAWMIPKDATKPVDRRTKTKKDEDLNMSLPRKTPFLYMTDLYNKPGTADESIESLFYNHEAQVLFDAEIAYSRGEIDYVYEKANYLLSKHSGFYAIISAGMLLALCAIWKGDLSMWRRAKVHISEVAYKNDKDIDIVSFSITAVDSMLYNVSSFPEWFKMGCFELLHKDSLPAAKVYYAKYLYAAAYGVATKEVVVEGVEGLALMKMIPNTIEPMISQAVADNSIIVEIYLRLTCAVVYHNANNETQAIRHIDKAIALALPDKLYGLLAEYCRTIGYLLEMRIKKVDEEAWDNVKVLYDTYIKGWSKLSGNVRGRTILTTLTAREREIAKLAAFGMQYQEIAEKVNMSVSGVKQSIKNISDKSGLSRKEFAAIL